MTPQELDRLLRTPTKHELLYRNGRLTTSPLDRFETVMVNGQPQRVLQLPGKLDPLTGSKHSRYRAYPIHVHPWVELIYMYSGSCTQKVNGIPVTLRQGQMLLLDQNTVHELPVLGDDDILLNIIVCKEYLTAAFFNRISQKNIISQFFINAITDGLAHDMYLFFATEDSRRLPLFIQEFFCEVYDPSACAVDVMNSMFTLILTELIQVCQKDDFLQVHRGTQESSVLPILKYIESNYRQISLADTASRFNLSPHYLSNMLKGKIGYSFQTLVTRQRMLAARQLLLNSSLSVTEVANQVGYENTTFFYKKFQTLYGCSPSEYRRQEMGQVGRLDLQ